MSSGTVRDGNLNHSCLDLFIMYLANENMIFVLLEFFLQVPKLFADVSNFFILDRSVTCRISREHVTHPKLKSLEMAACRQPHGTAPSIENRVLGPHWFDKTGSQNITVPTRDSAPR